MIVPLNVVALHAGWTGPIVADPRPGRLTDDLERPFLQSPVEGEHVDISGPDGPRCLLVETMVTGPGDLDTQDRAKCETADNRLTIVTVP